MLNEAETSFQSSFNEYNSFHSMKKGFTSTELLIAITIFVIVTGAVYLAFNLSQKAYREGQNSAEITQNGRVIIERISREIRQAKEVIGDFPSAEEDATSSITFEDGHISDPYHYIHYFKTDSEVKREVLGFYFSGDPTQTLQPWEAIPPVGQTLATTTLETAVVIGEWVEKLDFWGSNVINIVLTLTKADKTLNLETKVFSRNF